MVLDRPGNRQLLAAVGVVLLLGLAGCLGLGGDAADDGTELETEPDAVEEVLETVDDGTAEEFSALVTDENGELTDDGETVLETLDTVDETDQREAAVEAVVAARAFDGEMVERVAVLLDSPEAFATEALAAGLTDTSGDGLADGEITHLGLDPADPDERVVDLAQHHREGGYDDQEIAALQRLAELDEFGWLQAEELGLLSDLDGDVTADDVAALEDSSGDGLLDGTAAELGVDATQPRDDLADLVRTLDDEAFTFAGRNYLERAVVILDNESLKAQATHLGLLDVDAATFSQEDVRALEDTAGDGLLDPMEEKLGLDPTEPDPDVAAVVAHLAVDGYGDREIQYVERVIELREYRGHDYEYWAQAEQLGLFDEEIADGSVSDEDLWSLENDAHNRLLNGMEVAFGTDPERNDTSGDGYADHLLWGPMQDLGLEVSPDSPNVFVEVDVADGVNEPSDEQLTAIQDAFENEPSEAVGPINLQFHVCHTEQEDIVNADDVLVIDAPHSVTEIEDLEPEHVPDKTADKRNVSGLGFKYLWLTDGLVAGGVQGFAPAQWVMEYGEIKSFAIADGTVWRSQGESYQAALIAHELAHALGIGAGDYVGVDSREISADEYDSVMNYNHPMDEVTFSTGEPFDDYQHMADRGFNNHYQDRSALESMWDEGSVDEDAVC